MELSSSVGVNFNYFCGFKIIFWDSQTLSTAQLFPVGRWLEREGGGWMKGGGGRGAGWRELALRHLSVCSGLSRSICGTVGKAATGQLAVLGVGEPCVGIFMHLNLRKKLPKCVSKSVC